MSKDLRNLLICIILSSVVLAAWQYLYESPRLEAINKQRSLEIQTQQANQEVLKLKELTESKIADEIVGKITINNKKLQGSISLRGLRFNDLKLSAYKETLDKNSPLVELFSDHNYFAEFGWLNNNTNLTVPDKNSVWQCNSAVLNSSQEVKCQWQNSDMVNYIITIALDENYLFSITQEVENNSAIPISLATYGRIFKAEAEKKQFAILHEGVIGVFSKVLKESTYEDLSKIRQESFTNTPGSWAGFTQKYWLSALMPDSKIESQTNLIASRSSHSSGDNFNVNYISNGITITPGEKFISNNHLFAGAKEEKILDLYEKENNFVLFDRAIDFGIFYFITKPLFLVISYFYSLLGNFGLAIIAVTLCLKMALYPLANKSFQSMAKLKNLSPQIAAIKEKYQDDRMKFNQEIMAFYKKEKVNPAAGCLPLLIQIPLFFSLYKVIFISLEMRHAPFYGWIKDLSAQDPTSIWNLFGLLPWGPIGMLDIGVWPILMGITMFVQQSLSPKPTDSVQAAVMRFMPLILMVMLYSLPSGLMIYWSFSNILSILQQYLINRQSKVK
jgi:YidC/Oxa1 family membrane protein insertase